MIDEVLSCCEMYDGLSKHDKDDLFQSGKMYVDEASRRLRWNNKDHGAYEGKFSQSKHLCDNGNLTAYASEHGGKSVLIWQFPTEFLECFEQTYVLTYLFQGSPMCAYLKAEGVDVHLKAVTGDRKKGYRLNSWLDHSEVAIKTSIRTIVTIYEGRGNDIGTASGRKHPLSSSWFKQSDVETLKRLKGNTVTFFKNHAKTCAHGNA